MALRIRLLGGFSLEHEGGVLPPLPTRTARSLLALLVTQRGRPHSRDRLAGTFWPDLPEARARRRLSHALWQLQQVLGEVAGNVPFIVVDADTVGFSDQADFWLDVEEFERLGVGSLAEMEQAIELYRGDYLAGSYDDWLLIEQQRLRRAYADLLRRATDGHKGLGEIAKALVYARRLVAHDPLAEEAQREVMRLSFLLGEFNDAIQQYEFCVSILSEELGAQPAAATTALYDTIVAQRAKGDRPFVPDPTSPLFQPGDVGMVGRVEERAAVIDRMTGAFAGRGGVVLVEGSVGVGISRFLSGLAEDAHWRGLGVLVGTARSSSTPYGLCRTALGDALSPLRIEQVTTIVQPVWLNAVATVFPELAPDGADAVIRLEPGEEGDRIAQALTEVLLAFGAISPHVVLLDDVHLADAETLAFLRLAARRLHTSNVLVVLGYNSAEARLSDSVWEALLDIDAQRGSDRLALAGLDETETAELVRLATAWPTDGAFLSSITAQTGGNPLLILETLRSIAQHADNEDSPPLTDVAAGLLEKRLRAAPPQTLRALQGAAIFDGPVPLEVIAKVTGLAKDDALRAVDDSLRRAFLIEVGDQVEFAHVQLKTATVGTIDPADLVVMHRKAARWFDVAHPERFEELAAHLLGAARPDRAAGAYLNAANRAADLYAFDTATRHLMSSLDAARQARIGDADLIEVLLQLEQLLDQHGRRREQGRALERVLRAATDPRDRLEAIRRRILFLANTDRYDEAEVTASDALTFASEHGLAPSGALAARGLALSRSGRPGEAMPYLRQAADQPDLDAAEMAETRYAAGMAMSSLDLPEADGELDEALALFRRAALPQRVADVLGLMATNNASRGQVALAEARFREAFDICRQIGFTHGEATHLSNLAALHYLEGRPAEALRGFEAALDSLAIIPNPRLEANILNNAAFVRHRIVGDDAGAATAARRALDYYSSVDNPRGAAQAVAILAGIEARRDPHAALDLFESHLQDLDSYGAWTAAHLHRRVAEINLAAGDIEAARRHCENAREWVVEGGLADGMAAVDGLSAQIALAAGEVERGLVAARSAVDDLGRGAEQAYLLYFTLYRAARDGTERRDALEESYRRLQETLRGFPPGERGQAEAVPEHAAIIDAWAAHHPVLSTLELGDVRGTGPRQVSLTVRSPDDEHIAGKVPRRRNQIKRMLTEANQQAVDLTTTDLAALLRVSPATIRRDLAAIRATGG